MYIIIGRLLYVIVRFLYNRRHYQLTLVKPLSYFCQRSRVKIAMAGPNEAQRTQKRTR